MRKNKKLLSLLMVIAMVVALLPVTSVYAVSTDSLEISQSVDTNEFSQVGDMVTYTYTFTNTGANRVNGPFRLMDLDTDTELDHSLFPEYLDPQESFSAYVTYTITADDISQNNVHIMKRVELRRYEPVGLVPLTSEAAISIHLGPGLNIKKTADKSEFTSVGEIINYTYTVTHTGLNETIYGSSEGNEEFILVDNKFAEPISSQGIIQLGQNPGENQSFTVTAEYTVTQADITRGSITNEVTVNGFYLDYPEDPIQAEAELTIPLKKQTGPGYSDRENPSLKLKKSADKKEFSEVGEIITYNYDISNSGNTLVRGDFYGSDDESFRLTDDKIAKIDMSKAPIELNPGKSFTVKAEYKVTQADIDAGKIKNVATVKGISGNYSLQDTDTLTIPYRKKPAPEVPKEPSIGDKLNMEDHFQYISGYPDNTVRPDGLITREEVAAVFYRLLTPSYRNSIMTNTHNFDDVKAGRWSEQSIATLAKGKIIAGYEDGSFRPGNSITRAELAAIASRFDQLTPFTSDKFSDIDKHWANQVINSASKKGWVNGYSDGTFRPNQHMTRAEFVALVNNVLNRGVTKENILPDAKQFPDLLEGKWYYETMQEAINSHHYTRDKDTGQEIWTEIY